MQINIERVLFWMDAIRNSKDRNRSLESFWKGQVHSKIWLIENLIPFLNTTSKNVVIHGGWNGVLASLIFQALPFIDNMVSIDIDPTCEETANTMNKIEEINGKFKAVTANMAEYQYDFFPDIVINTSCEHIDQKTYERWLSKIPNESIIVLQSNNYFEITEHIRCVVDINEFKKQSKINTLWCGSLELPLYKRFMIIGKK